MIRQFCAMTLMFVGSSANAQGEWTLGVVGVGTTGTYVGEKDESAIAPILNYETGGLNINLDGVTYDVFDFDQGNLAVALRYRGAPAFPDDDPLFDGLDRDDAIEAGFESQMVFGDAYVSFAAQTDVSDVHGGTEASVALGYAVAPGAFIINAEVGTRYRTDNLNQYLYGVSASEATSNRPEFAADDTITPFASLTAIYPLTDNVAAIGLIEYEDLGNIKDSPLVDKTEVFGIGLGVVMTF